MRPVPNPRTDQISQLKRGRLLTRGGEAATRSVGGEIGVCFFMYRSTNTAAAQTVPRPIEYGVNSQSTNSILSGVPRGVWVEAETRKGPVSP